MRRPAATERSEQACVSEAVVEPGGPLRALPAVASGAALGEESARRPAALAAESAPEPWVGPVSAALAPQAVVGPVRGESAPPVPRAQPGWVVAPRQRPGMAESVQPAHRPGLP